MTDFCASASRRRAEPMYGTASRAQRWILFEHPGSWGSDALLGSGLEPQISERLLRWSRELPARVLLLRRTRGRSRSGAVRSLFAGISSTSGSWIEEFELDSTDAILDLDLEALSTGSTVGGRRLNRPLYLVCTNGKHDACCARDGLPVARELARTLGDRVWECSHVGGDRFAGNLVCLPDGQFYGHVDPTTARSIVEANESGELVLDHWRGRSCHPFAVQAAEYLVRQELGLVADADLRVTAVQRERSQYDVTFARRDGSRLRARLAVTEGPMIDPITCAGAGAIVPGYELMSIRAG